MDSLEEILEEAGVDEPFKREKVEQAVELLLEDIAGRAAQKAVRNSDTFWEARIESILRQADDRAAAMIKVSEDKTEERMIEERTTDEIRRSLNCTVCFELMLPPIKQCTEGHPVCMSCCNILLLETDAKCPTCRIPLHPPSRALQLEQVAKNIKFACKWEGCTAKCAYGDYARHIASCPHMPADAMINGKRVYTPMRDRLMALMTRAAISCCMGCS